MNEIDSIEDAIRDNIEEPEITKEEEKKLETEEGNTD